GEVCHFVDTCSALVGDQEADSAWIAGYGAGEAMLRANVVAGLQYGDGSLATVTYLADGHADLGKERIEVIGRGHTAVIDDFNSIALDGRPAVKGEQDKGHVAEVKAFRAALAGTGRIPDFFATTRTTLTLASLLGSTQR